MAFDFVSNCRFGSFKFSVIESQNIFFSFLWKKSESKNRRFWLFQNPKKNMWFFMKEPTVTKAVIGFCQKNWNHGSLSLSIYIRKPVLLWPQLRNLKNRNDNLRGFVPVYDYHPALVITKATKWNYGHKSVYSTSVRELVGLVLATIFKSARSTLNLRGQGFWSTGQRQLILTFTFGCQMFLRCLNEWWEEEEGLAFDWFVCWFVVVKAPSFFLIPRTYCMTTKYLEQQAGCYNFYWDNNKTHIQHWD